MAPVASFASLILLNGVLYINILDINTILINCGQPVFQDVQSNGNVLTAVFKGKNFKVIAGTKTFIYDKRIYYTDSLIFNINDVIYIPLKSFFNNLGYTVNTQYDTRTAIQKSFYYYTKKFTYYVLQGQQTYTYLNGVIYMKTKRETYTKIVYIELYDKLPEDFLTRMRMIFSNNGLNMKIVPITQITLKPTVVFKQGSQNLLWINFLKKTQESHKYYLKFGYNGPASYSLAQMINYDKLLICPTTMLDNTMIGFVCLFTTTSEIKLNSIVKGINEFYQSY